MTSDRSPTLTVRFLDVLIENIHRIFLLSGFGSFYVALEAYQLDLFFWTVVYGFVGGWLIGGWPTLKRLIKSPRWQLVQWYLILINARQYHHREQDDGSVDVIEMRPTNWGWTEVRDFER